MSEKAYLFDAFGTLFQLELPNDLLEQKLGSKAEKLMDIWRNRQLRYTWLHSLMQDYVPFGEISKKALDYAMDCVAVQDEDLKATLLSIYFKANAHPDVPDMLDRMRKKDIQLCILSNGEPKMLEAGAKHSGILDKLDHLFSVDSIRTFKPDPGVYQMALDHLGFQKSDVRFFSSNQWDVAGATKFGFKTTWVNRKNEIREPITDAPDQIIRSFDEL